MEHSSPDGHVGHIAYLRIAGSCEIWYDLSIFDVSGIGSLWAGTLSLGGVVGDGRCCDVWEFSRNTSVRQSVALSSSRESQVRVVVDVPSAGRETDCFLWVIQQANVVGCCPGVQAFTFKGCFSVNPFVMLAIEVANIQIGVWEHRDGRWCKS